MSSVISIPPWSDSNAMSKKAETQLALYISIPPWSDSNFISSSIVMVNGLFQSHHGLILTISTFPKHSIPLCQFQSHHGLILTTRLTMCKCLSLSISIPPWSDSNDNFKIEQLNDDIISIPPWSDSNGDPVF